MDRQDSPAPAGSVTECVLATLSRAWDDYDAYLFDIDGTLLHCSDAVHYYAFCAALHWLSGRPLTLEGVTAHGNTDVGILRDALSLAGFPEEKWRDQIPAACAGMCTYVEARKDSLCANLMPGVCEVLGHLERRGAMLGVATGNLERIGRFKLSRCGILERFRFGGYSDAFERRTDVFRHAVQQVRRMLHTDAAICVIGDTPADIKAAHENGVEIVAVAPGVYSVKDLSAHQPELCTASLQQLLV
jgi:phosphoglycolate phosphatase-like HAD superfamily hydrolase